MSLLSGCKILYICRSA